jgi:hypothetical protein
MEDWLKDRRKVCNRDGRLTEGQKMKGLLQGLKTG